MILRTFNNYDCKVFYNVDYISFDGYTTSMYTESADSKYELLPDKTFRIYEFVDNAYKLITSMKITSWEVQE